jgi:hypothetical protein
VLTQRSTRRGLRIEDLGQNGLAEPQCDNEDARTLPLL